MSSPNGNPFDEEEKQEIDMEDPPTDTAMAAADLQSSSSADHTADAVDQAASPSSFQQLPMNNQMQQPPFSSSYPDSNQQ